MKELPTEPGARLRRQRELLGLSEQQAAEQLNLDVMVVGALEREDYAALGAPVFVKGHLKRYAAMLGLPEDDVLGAYERSRSQLGEPTLIPKSREEMLPERGPSRWPWLVGSVVLFLLAAAVAAYVNQNGLRLPAWAGGGQPAGTTGSAETTATALPAETVVAPPEARSPAGPAEADGPGAGAAPAGPPQATADGSAAAPGASAATGPVTGMPSSTTPALPSGQLSLSLRFAADSWVEIYDGSGRAVLYDLGKSGTERSFAGTAPLSFTLGNAPAVSLRVNGRPVAIPAPPRGQTVARFSLGPDGSVR